MKDYECSKCGDMAIFEIIKDEKTVGWMCAKHMEEN